jgi:hypothetical protein
VVRRSAGYLPVTHLGAIALAGTHGDVYRVGDCKVIQTDRTHLSISCEGRDPTWEEIASARYVLLPRLRDCVMLLPPDDEYVNAHEHCFHVHVLRTLAPGGSFHNEASW